MSIPSIVRLKQKQSALNMYLSGRLTQKEIAKVLNVSEKTISKWVKENGWKKINTGILSLKGDEHVIARFLTYVQNENPELYQSLNGAFKSFVVYNKVDYLNSKIDN